MQLRAQFERLVPAGLVPLAWGFAGAALFTTLVDRRTLLIGLVVMGSVFAVFAAHPRMGEGALATWRAVLAAGVLLNATGVVGALALADPTVPFAVTLYGWAVVPAAGMLRTRRALPGRPDRYLLFAALSVGGAGLVVLAGLFPAPVVVGAAGVAAVGLGQTASVFDAAARNRVA
jgi:hypothetical protein